jgi:hypothetical protein
MRLQFSRNFSLEILNLYWDSLPFRGGFIFSLRINWKRIVSYEQDIEMPRHAPDAHLVYLYGMIKNESSYAMDGFMMCPPPCKKQHAE